MQLAVLRDKISVVINMLCNFYKHEVLDSIITDDDEWLSEKNYELIKKCFSKEERPTPSVSEFKKRYRKKLFKGGKLSLPNYCLGECGKLFHIRRMGELEHKREVVFMTRAKELVQGLHQQTQQGICVPGGINTLVRSFTATYYFRGIRERHTKSLHRHMQIV